jgi:signal transduction histidine kinase/CheY-like chemotaxis protein
MLAETTHRRQPARVPALARSRNALLIKRLRLKHEILIGLLPASPETLTAVPSPDQVLALLAHELRDPLAPLRTSVVILDQAGGGNPVIQQANDIINRQVTRLTRLVDDLVDATRLAQGRIAMVFQDLDLGNLLETVAADYWRLAESAGVRLELALPGAALWASGDPQRLGQVLARVLENAIQCTNPGGQVALALEADPPGRALIRIRDTGIGMDPATLAHAFEPFVRGASAAARGGGLGLGLALARGLAALHGGAISAYSAGPGQGSQFTVSLPLLTLQPAASPEPLRKASRPQPQRILIVEDLSDAAITLEMLLEMLGHQVEIASDGQTALDKAGPFQPDVILCDIGLPGHLDGYDVARGVRADPSLAKVHLIALTGFNSREDKDKARQAGFDLHLTKPVDPMALEQLLVELPPRFSRDR